MFITITAIISGGGLPYETGGDARGEFELTLLSETTSIPAPFMWESPRDSFIYSGTSI